MKLEEVKYLKEGGAAVANAGVTRIARGDIPKTIEYVSNIVGIPVVDMRPLGSVGKTSTSGDIDVAIDESKYDSADVHKTMMDALGNEENGKYNPGTKVGSYAVPIAGDPKKGLVQFDLMFVPNTNWAEFSYFSAGDASEYKGAIRAILLSAVASSLDRPGTDAFVYDENGDLLVRAGQGMQPSLGMKRMFQMRGKNKRTGARLKTMKNVSPEEIRKEFPDLKFDGNQLIIDDPQQVMEVLFGKGIKPSDVDTVEDTIKLIRNSFSSERSQKIFDVAKKRAAPLKGKMAIPNELQ